MVVGFGQNGPNEKALEIFKQMLCKMQSLEQGMKIHQINLKLGLFSGVLVTASRRVFQIWKTNDGKKLFDNVLQ